MKSIFLICVAIFFQLLLHTNGAKQKPLSTCGIRSQSPCSVIFVGSNENWPWHAAVYHVGIQRQGKSDYAPEYKCSGTLIDTNTILTAAHCISIYNQPLNAENVLVSLGKLKLSTSEFSKVSNIIQHPNYSHVDLSNDIAIIKLSTQITFDHHIQPICLWDSSKSELGEVVGKMGTVVGWGRTETGHLSDILQREKMPVVDNVVCLESNRNFFGAYLSTKTFCAGSRNGTVCNGDNGGSLAFKENGVYYIRGIVSLKKRAEDSETLCDPNEFTLFTDVAKHLTWIAELAEPQ